MLDSAALIYPSDVAAGLQKLIELKSIRDNVAFTASKLAKAIDVDRSLIQRILKGKVQNPRIDTLIKITQYFVDEDFSLTVDDLTQWETQVVAVQEQAMTIEETNTFPLYHSSEFNGNPFATATVRAPRASPSTVAILADVNMGSICPENSIFIVDMLREPAQGNLVAIRLGKEDGIIVRRYFKMENSSPVLKGQTPDVPDIIMDEQHEVTIIGVVTRTNQYLGKD